MPAPDLSKSVLADTKRPRNLNIPKGKLSANQTVCAEFRVQGFGNPVESPRCSREVSGGGARHRCRASLPGIIYDEGNCPNLLLTPLRHNFPNARLVLLLSHWLWVGESGLQGVRSNIWKAWAPLLGELQHMAMASMHAAPEH